MINGNCVFKTVEYAENMPNIKVNAGVYFEEDGWFETLSRIDLETMPHPTLSFSSSEGIDLKEFAKELKKLNPVDILGFKISYNGEFKGFAQAIITDGFNDLVFLV